MHTLYKGTVVCTRVLSCVVNTCSECYVHVSTAERHFLHTPSHPILDCSLH